MTCAWFQMASFVSPNSVIVTHRAILGFYLGNMEIWSRNPDGKSYNRNKTCFLWQSFFPHDWNSAVSRTCVMHLWERWIVTLLSCCNILRSDAQLDQRKSIATQSLTELHPCIKKEYYTLKKKAGNQSYIESIHLIWENAVLSSMKCACSSFRTWTNERKKKWEHVASAFKEKIGFCVFPMIFLQ